MPLFDARARFMASAEEITVEVVAALPDRQALCSIRLPAGANVADAVAIADMQARFPEIKWTECEYAIWGIPVAADRALQDGDRVEVLRPLALDPRDARRELARAGQFMGTAGRDED